ncbi:MAG TPA: class I SAM-dependent methyltransferase [Thermoplasmata archaeon]
MAPWKYTDESYKEYTRTTWNESAQNYSKILRWLEPYGFDLLARVDPKIRERALDIATGPGEPALSMARMVGPEGDVIGIDLSEKMIERATNGAKERRIANAAFRVMDAEKMDFPDDTFDLATSRFGFQIFTNPEAVAAEAYRVLKPKGRIGATVWGTAEKAAALHVIVGPMLEFAEPDETGYLPTPYELGGPGEMVKLLEDAGFSETKEDRKTHSFVWKDEAEYLETILGGTPLGHSLKEEDPPVQEKILARTRENLRKWRKGRTIEIPCECVIATARK